MVALVQNLHAPDKQLEAALAYTILRSFGRQIRLARQISFLIYIEFKESQLTVHFIAGFKHSASFLRADLIQEAEDPNLDIVAVISVLGNKMESYGRTSLDIVSGINERDLFRLYNPVFDIVIVKRFLYQFNRVHALLLCCPLRCVL